MLLNICKCLIDNLGLDTYKLNEVTFLVYHLKLSNQYKATGLLTNGDLYSIHKYGVPLAPCQSAPGSDCIPGQLPMKLLLTEEFEQIIQNSLEKFCSQKNTGDTGPVKYCITKAMKSFSNDPMLSDTIIKDH